MEVRFEINNRAELRQLLDMDSDDLKDNQVHTNRELALMLAGSKPLAAFVDVHPFVDGAFGIPEREFEPHVARLNQGGTKALSEWKGDFWGMRTGRTTSISMSRKTAIRLTQTKARHPRPMRVSPRDAPCSGANRRTIHVPRGTNQPGLTAPSAIRYCRPGEPKALTDCKLVTTSWLAPPASSAIS